MKKYLFTIVVTVLAGGALAQAGTDRVVIEGVLNGDLKGYNTMYMYTRTSNDSAEIRDGRYTFSFRFTKPVMKMLYPQYIQAMHQMYQPFGILIDGPGLYSVTSDIGKGMHASALKGPEAMVLYQQFENDQSAAFKKRSAVLGQLYGEKWWQVAENAPMYAQIQQSSDSLSEVYIVPVIEKLVKEHPDSYASAFVLSGAGRQTGSLARKEQWFGMLSARQKRSAPGQNFADYINGLKRSSLGSTVSNFVLPDPQGKEVDFKNLKGKYVLIDFWASWCVPCRRSFPHMREVYKKYKSDQFEIYSISIDEDKAAWLKAVKEEKNPWLQSLDTKNISQSGFAVTGVPSTFLIDPQGKIVAKEVGFDPDGGSEIEKKLKQLFN